GGIDAIAQPAAIARAVVEHMPEMAIAMLGAHLDAAHAVRIVVPLADVGRLDRLGEARPAAARFVLVRGGEERLARHDVDVDAGLLVVEIFAGSRPLGPALLRHPILLRGELGYDLRILAVCLHSLLLARRPAAGV